MATCIIAAGERPGHAGSGGAPGEVSGGAAGGVCILAARDGVGQKETPRIDGPGGFGNRLPGRPPA